MLPESFRISFSKYKKFRQCPLRFYFEHVLKAPYFLWGDVWFLGSYLQNLFERSFQGRIRLTPDTFESFVTKDIYTFISKENIHLRKKPTYEQIHLLRDDYFVSLVELYNRFLSTKVQVERSFDIMLPIGKTHRRFTGKADYVFFNEYNNNFVEICDGKYGKHRLPNDTLYWYSLLFWQSTGIVPKRASYLYYKLKTYEYVNITKSLLLEFYHDQVVPDITKMVSDSVGLPEVPNCFFCPYSHSQFFTLSDKHCVYNTTKKVTSLFSNPIAIQDSLSIGGLL